MLFSNREKMALTFVAAIFFVCWDRFFKILALKAYSSREFSLIGDIFKFSLAKNYNIAFSLPFSGLLLIITTAIIIIGLIYYSLILYKKEKYKYLSYLTIIIFGAISNIADRIKFGFVIDYLDLKYFTIFNIADVMIVGGVLVFFLKAVKLKH